MPKFFKLLLESAGTRRFMLPLWIAVAGVGMASMMAIVNTVADRKTVEEVHFDLLAVFVFSATLVIFAQSRAMRTSTRLCESMLERVRVRFAHLVRHAELDAFERIGRNHVYGILARDTAILSEAGFAIVHGAISSVALILSGLYVFLLSTVAFIVVVVLFGATVFAYHYSQRMTRAALMAADRAELRFFDTFNHLLGGFKEVKQSWRRGDDLETVHLVERSLEVQDRKVEAVDRINSGMALSYAAFYLLLATVVFALPQHLDDPQTAVKITYVVIFILSTLEVTLKAIPMLAKASLAIDTLNDLERQLSAARVDGEADGQDAAQTFEAIELTGTTFNYVDKEGRPTFTIGPCDLKITRGEMIFLVGGNGSGKSSFLRLLCRLYEPRRGVMLWDGVEVDRANVVDYRNLFAAVFSDFHLFDVLYGMATIDPDRVNALLEDIGIGNKTRYVDGAFTNLDLSTGQRKRLAYVVALLEEKPILVLDELAADQDPEFRRRFYESILPDLKAAGKTLIVVSHDERYFDMADRTLRLQDGRFVDGDGLA